MLIKKSSEKEIYYTNEAIEDLINSRQTAVFGAGIMAQGVVNCLLEKPYQLQIECCIVSDLQGNPDSVAGVPVVDFAGAEGLLRKDALIVAAAVGKGLESMENSLHEHGYFRIIPLTYEGDLWSLIRGNYYREYRLSQQKSYLTLEEELGLADAGESGLAWVEGIAAGGSAPGRRAGGRSLAWKEGTAGSGFLPDGNAVKSGSAPDADVCRKKVSVYTARCHADRKLQEDVSRFSWEIPIQAGAALTGERICSISDSTGDNISRKNRQYCELTALYWIWKNDASDYVGLGHYRRHFELTDGQRRRLACSDIDVVLTIPIYDFPSVREVYCRDHVEKDWNVMMEAVSVLAPDYMEAALELQKGRFYYAYNMFIMRREILEDYCGWLFPILEYCEARCEEKGNVYQNRFIGFLAEHLMSVYFLHHEKEYKIVHAAKHFIEK